MAAILTFSPSLSDRLTTGGVHLWELNRRAGHDYELLRPEAAIDPSEDEVSINAAIAMRDQFGNEAPAVRVLFDAIVALLAGSGPKH